MGFKNLAILIILAALWGSSFLFIRIAAPVMGPVWLIELRVLLAGLTLLGVALAQRRLPPLRAHWKQYLVVGAVNSALPFVLIAAAELELPASLAATLNATTPLFGALVAAVWMGERLTLRRIAGLLLGVAGVAALVGLGPLPLNPTTLLAMGASLLAALCYGVGAVYTKVKAAGAEPEGLSLYGQLFAAAVLLPLAPFAIPAAAPGPGAVASLLVLALLCTALAYRLYFYLIAEVGPTRATMVTYLSPVFGMLWGALFLHEHLGLAAIAGFAMILGSVALVSPSQERSPARSWFSSRRFRSTPQR